MSTLKTSVPHGRAAGNVVGFLNRKGSVLASHRNQMAELAADPQVDLGVLPALLGYALRRAQLTAFGEFYAAMAELDLRPAAFSVLEVIRRNRGLRPSQVAQALGIKRTNFVPLIEGLERRGLVARTRDEADRRAFQLHLTRDGEILLTAARRRARAQDKALRRRLAAGEDVELLGYLKKLG